MQLRVKLFAIAKERAGRTELRLELPAGSTIGDLQSAVASRCPALADIRPHVLWSVDAAYANSETILTDKSEVAIIPPVSGG